MGLSMRRDKWANPIRFDNLDPLRSVFGRTQCCKITTLLSPASVTGQTRAICNRFGTLTTQPGLNSPFPAYFIDRRAASRSSQFPGPRDTTVRPPFQRLAGQRANQLASPLQVREVVDLGPEQVPDWDGLGLEPALSD